MCESTEPCGTLCSVLLAVVFCVCLSACEDGKPFFEVGVHVSVKDYCGGILLTPPTGVLKLYFTIVIIFHYCMKTRFSNSAFTEPRKNTKIPHK